MSEQDYDPSRGYEVSGAKRPVPRRRRFVRIIVVGFMLLLIAFSVSLYFGREIMFLFITSEGRPLTSGERELVTEIFGDSIDLDTITIYKESYFPMQKNIVCSPDGNVYYPTDGWWYADDISTLGIDQQALLLHELTHVWQHQNGRKIHIVGFFQFALQLMTRGAYDPYRLPSVLSPARNFADYNTEQQGDIVRNYFYITKGYRGNGDETTRDVYENLIPFLETK